MDANPAFLIPALMWGMAGLAGGLWAIRTGRSLRRLQHLAHRAEQVGHLGSWWLRPGGRVQPSGACRALHGLPPRGAVDLAGLAASIDPDDLAAFQAAVAEARGARRPARVAYRLRVGSAPEHLVDCRLWPVGREVLAVLHDASAERDRARRMSEIVSELQAAVQAEADRAQQLAETGSRLEAILAVAGDGLVAVDREQSIIAFSDGAERIFGFARSEVLGRPVDMLMPSVLRERHRRHVAAFRDASEPGQGPMGNWRRIQGQRKDGTVFPMSSFLYRERLPGGGVRMSVILRDMSEILAQETALTIARLEAVQASQAKSQFLASMSHELRTPLNSVLGFAQLLERAPGPLTPAQRDYVSYIRRGGEQLLFLINDVLDLSKIETGRLAISLEVVEVAEVVRTVVKTLMPLADRHEVTLAQEEMVAGLMVQADRGRLIQALSNLVANAAKYNRAGGTVVVRTDLSGPGHVRLTVVDTGLGIPEQRQPELFGAFNRLGFEAGLIEGTGLGLVLTKRIVEMMGGALDFRSVHGEGSAFWIDLPRVVQPRRDLAAAARAGRQRDGARRRLAQRSPLILYIEDNPANVVLMEVVLQGLGTVITAATGRAGLDLALAHRPDLVIVDINLPDVDGFEVLVQLRRHAETARIPAVALSADAMPRDVRRGLSAGFLAYLTKPFVVDELLQVILAALDAGGDGKGGRASG